MFAFCLGTSKLDAKLSVKIENFPINGLDNISAQTFSFRELAVATKNFKADCLLGEGGFGRVYKGKLMSTNQVSDQTNFV